MQQLKPLPLELYLPSISLVAHANEHRRASGIMTDRTAHEWFEALCAVYKDIPDPPQELINGIITRSMIIDYAVLDFLSHHQRVVVSDLGCGFSTRYYRLGPFIEGWTHIDLPDVLQARCAFQPMSRFEMAVGRDLNALADDSTPFPMIADAAKYMMNLLFIVEGVLNHLAREKAIALIKVLQRRFPGAMLIGTAMYERAMEAAKTILNRPGTTFPMWGLSDTFSLETFLKPARVQRTWLLGKAARMLGLVRPERDDEASGVVFLAKL